MSYFKICNAGAKINGYDNGDGTYTVVTHYTKDGSRATVKILSEEEVIKKIRK